jgi:hypothetical protein
LAKSATGGAFDRVVTPSGWELYDNLDEIKEKVRTFLEEFSSETIASITGWDYILSALTTVA